MARGKYHRNEGVPLEMEKAMSSNHSVLLSRHPRFTPPLRQKLLTYCAENWLCCQLTILRTSNQFQRNIEFLLRQKPSLLIICSRPNLIK
jgi:hypothetical protein